MSRPAAPIVCDGPGCTNQKRESNHWWTIQARAANKFNPATIVLTSGTIGTTVAAEWKAVAAEWKEFDACGHECALKIVSEQMGKVTS